MAKTRDLAGGGLRKGDRPNGKEIAENLKSVIDNLPKSVKKIRAHADSGFSCWDAVKAYEGKGCEFVLVARKTPRLVDEFQGRKLEEVQGHGGWQTDRAFQALACLMDSPFGRWKR